jgi:cyanoexosortase A
MKARLITRDFSLANKVHLWRLLALLLVVQSVIFFGFTQSPDDVLFVLLGRWGAYLALENGPAPKRLVPTPSGAWLGFGLILWVLWRSLLITSSHLGASLLPFLAGLGLTLMATPLRRIRRFLPSLLILTLLPLMRALQIPYPTLVTYATAILTKLILLIFGLSAQVQGNLVALPGGTITVASQCTGLAAMLQLLMVSLIFAIVFPMRYFWQNILMSFCAVCLGFLVNGFRIALLALINSSQLSSKLWWFDLFHNGWSAWIFPGIAAFLFINLYVFWLGRQVAFLEGQSS